MVKRHLWLHTLLRDPFLRMNPDFRAGFPTHRPSVGGPVRCTLAGPPGVFGNPASIDHGWVAFRLSVHETGRVLAQTEHIGG